MADVTDDMADDFVTGAASDDAARMTREQVVAGLTAALAAAPAPTITDAEVRAIGERVYGDWQHPQNPAVLNEMQWQSASDAAEAAARARQESREDCPSCGGSGHSPCTSMCPDDCDADCTSCGGSGTAPTVTDAEREAAHRAALDLGWTCMAHEPLGYGDCTGCNDGLDRLAEQMLTAAARARQENRDG